jgi:hypothetical protein
MLTISSSTQRSVNERNPISYYRRKETLEESKKQNTEINNNMKRNPLRKQDLPLRTAMPASLSPYTTKTGGEEEGEKALELGKRIAYSTGELPHRSAGDTARCNAARRQIAHSLTHKTHSLFLSLSLSLSLQDSWPLGKTLGALTYPWEKP